MSQLTTAPPFPKQEPSRDKSHHLPRRETDSAVAREGWAAAPGAGKSPASFPHCPDPLGLPGSFLSRHLTLGVKCELGFLLRPQPWARPEGLVTFFQYHEGARLLTAGDSVHGDGTRTLLPEVGPWKARQRTDCPKKLSAGLSFCYFSA